MINVEHLSYEYPDTRALDDISFNIAGQTITALVGPNGAGKTTLLKCIAGLMKPYSGNIVVGGIDVLKEPRRSHANMGFLPDFFGLYDALTVRQSLEYFASAQRLEKHIIADRAAEVAALLNLTDKIDSLTSSLSRGMRQRLAIGQAIIHYPKVLLLDEPASGLDPEARIALAELFLALNEEKKMTIVVSSHILAELEQYAKDLLILKSGSIVEQKGVSDKNEQRRIMIRCQPGGTNENVGNILHEFDCLSNIAWDSEYFCADFKGSDPDMRDLLKKLILEGMPVIEFFVKREGVQEQYLTTMKS